MQWSSGPTCWWHGNMQWVCHLTQPPLTFSNCSPLLTGWIAPKLGSNIKHWWYNRSLENQSAAPPRSSEITPKLTQAILLLLRHMQAFYPQTNHISNKVQCCQPTSAMCRTTPDVMCCVARPRGKHIEIRQQCLISQSEVHHTWQKYRLEQALHTDQADSIQLQFVNSYSRILVSVPLKFSLYFAQFSVFPLTAVLLAGACQGNGYRKILKPCQKAGCGNLVVLLTERNLEGVDEGTNLLSTLW